MATKMNPSSRKPPLARSPIRLRSRRVLQSAVNPIQTTPPGSLSKTSMAKTRGDSEEVSPHPEYQSISCELRALAKMVHQELGQSNEGNAGLANTTPAAAQSPLFERGRFYDEYSARRTERLKRKKGEASEEKKQPSYNLGVRVESVKKREIKRFDSVRTAATICSTPVTERRREAASSSSRYSLRSTTGKENKKVIGAKTSSAYRGIRKN